MLNMGGEEILPPSHLGPHGSNIVMGERSSLEGLQGAAFQTSMKCNGKDMAWENGDPHERKTNGEKRRRHPQGVEWVWMRRKILINHFQIYDTGK